MLFLRTRGISFSPRRIRRSPFVRTAGQLMVALCKLKDLPDHLRFNPFVYKGYRPPMSARECMKSLFYLHNETFNTYSHALVAIYFALQYQSYENIWQQSLANKLLCVLHMSCAVLPFVFSFLYHLFMPHDGGAQTYNKLLRLDVFGVWCITTIGAILSLLPAMQCHLSVMLFSLCVYLPVSFATLWMLMTCNTARHRVIALTVQYFARVAILSFRICPLSSGHPLGLYYIIAVDCISAPGALVNGLKVPERLLPGKVDYFGNGHSIMHILAFLVTALGHKAFLLDMEWSLARTCQKM